MTLEDKIKVGFSCIPAVILIVPLLVVLVPDAIRNRKKNKELEGLPDFKDKGTCPTCEFPIWPPLQFRNDFPNFFCPLKWAVSKAGCNRCGYEVDVKVEINA